MRLHLHHRSFTTAIICGLTAASGLGSASAAIPAPVAAKVTVPQAVSRQVARTPVANRTMENRPEFTATLPQEINKKIIREVHWKITSAYNTPLLAADTTPESITISGPAEATPEQMVHFIRKRNPQPRLTCSIEEIVNYYYQEAGREGIRPDVALCQALKETGFFAYGGDVSPKQNNFCGLGATGNHEPGLSFATAQLGVRAHIQHLLAYTSRQRPSVQVVDPRYDLLIQRRPDLHGKVSKWTGLNGAWAVPGRNYGQEILSLWRQAQAPDASDAALAAANKKLHDMPDEADAYIYRGIVWYNRQNYDAAMHDFTTALKFAPSSSEALYNRAITAVKQGNTKTAEQDYDALLLLQPRLNPGWYNRGLLRYEHHDIDGAIADMEQLLAIEDRSADARNLIGVCHIQQKKYDEAWKDFADAAAINSANMNVLANQFIMEACLK